MLLGPHDYVAAGILGILLFSIVVGLAEVARQIDRHRVTMRETFADDGPVDHA